MHFDEAWYGYARFNPLYEKRFAMRGDPSTHAKDAPTVFGLGGVGGSFACGDTASGIAWAVTKNRVSNDFSTSTRLGQLITGSG